MNTWKLSCLHGLVCASLSLSMGCQGSAGGSEDEVDATPDDMGAGQEMSPVTSTSSLVFVPAPEDWNIPLGEPIEDVALLDASGDDVLDVIVLTEAGPIKVMRGDGAAGFQLPEEPIQEAEEPLEEDPMMGEQEEPSPAVLHLLGADLDGDAKSELITCEGASGVLSVYAPGDFSRGKAQRSPVREYACAGLVSGDFDADGMQDVAELLDLGEEGLGVSVWRHEKIDEHTRALRALIATPQGPFARLGSYRPVALLASDFDGDGRAELAVAESSRVIVFALVGTSLREVARIPDVDGVRVLSALDVDGDGLRDLHVGIRGDQDRLFLSDGRGRFAEATWSMLPVEDSLSVTSVVTDLDQDGSEELVIGTSDGFDRLYHQGGDARARLIDLSPQLGFVETRTHALFAGDLDGDEDLDLVSVSALGEIIVYAQQHTASKVLTEEDR